MIARNRGHALTHHVRSITAAIFAITLSGCGGTADDPRQLDLQANQSKSSYDRADYAGPARPAGAVSGVAAVVPERPRAVAGNVVLNAGFETGSTSWTQSSTAGYNLISAFSQSPAYAGTQYAWLGGYSDGTDTLYQDVTVPSSGSQAKLQFWQRISTEEISTSKAYDTLAIELYNPTTGAKLATLATLSNLNANTAWTQSPQYDLTAYKGQRVRIKFTATLDVTDNSSFRFDEVNVFPLDSTSNGSPQTGIWWNPSESGSGLVIEQQGAKILLGTFVYDDSGANTWYVSTLTKQTDGSFTGDVLRSAGGQSLTGAYRAPTSSTAVAKVTLSFASGTTGTLALQSTVGAVLRTISIERFPIVNPPFTTPSSSFERGFWWNESEAGRGFFIEVQGSQVLVSSFMYDSLGQPIWYSGTAPLQTSQSFSIPLLQYANGQSLSGTYRAPSQTAGSAGNLQFTFDSATTGTMTLPNGRTVAMKRVVFDTSASAGTGSGTTGGTNTGSTATLASFAGTYTVAASDGTTGSFTVDASGNVTSCRVGVVVSCTGRLTFNSGTGGASFTISGNDGQNPIDTTATLNGNISSTGTVSGSYSASSVSEGAASGSLTGSKSSTTGGSTTGTGTTTGSGSGTGSTTNGGTGSNPTTPSTTACTPPKILLNGSCVAAIKELSFSKSKLTFATQEIFTTSPVQSVELINTGNVGVSLKSIYTPLTFGGRWRSIDTTTCINLPIFFEKGQRCRIDLVFEPFFNNAEFQSTQLTIGNNLSPLIPRQKITGELTLESSDLVSTPVVALEGVARYLGVDAKRCIIRGTSKTSPSQTLTNNCGQKIVLNWCHSPYGKNISSECGDDNMFYQMETWLEPGEVKENQFSLPLGTTLYYGACLASASGTTSVSGGIVSNKGGPNDDTYKCINYL